MSKDKTTEHIGKILKERMGRDAIHIAVAPMIARQNLNPGDHIGIVSEGRAGACETPIDIVDPFLDKPVQIGERFFMFLYPNTITSLNHVWTHPAFGAEDKLKGDKAQSEQWLREYVKRNCPYYDDDGIKERYGVEDGYSKFVQEASEGTVFYYGTDCHCRADVEEPEELERHLSVILGMPFRLDDDMIFTCSC